MLHIRKTGGNTRVNDQHSLYAPTLESMMREVLHTLGNIDFQHEAELEELEASPADHAVKKHVRERLLARYRERREPYVELLAGLRKHQHRQAFAS